MPLLDIFFGARPVVGDLQMDASLNETHTEGTEWTDNPVEEGASLSDHATDMRAEITIDGVVSRLLDPTRLAGPDPSFNISPTRHLKAWNILLSMKKRHELVTVVTSLATYRNMAIQTITATRNLEASEALFFSVTLREVQFATTSNVANNLAGDLADAVGVDDQGTQSTSAANSGTGSAAAGGV